MNNEQKCALQYPHPQNHFSSRDFGFICDVSEAEYAGRPSVYVIVSDQNGDVATIKFRKEVERVFCLPGGGVEEGETFTETITREAKEEIGCEIKNIEQLGSFESYCNKSKRRFENIICKADLDGEKGVPMPAEDYEKEISVVWKTMDDLKRQLEEISGVNKDKIEYRSMFVLKIMSHMI